MNESYAYKIILKRILKDQDIEAVDSLVNKYEVMKRDLNKDRSTEIKKIEKQLSDLYIDRKSVNSKYDKAIKKLYIKMLDELDQVYELDQYVDNKIKDGAAALAEKFSKLLSNEDIKELLS